MRAVDHDHARALRDKLLHLFPVDGEVGRLHIVVNGLATGQLYCGSIAVIGRREEYHFVILADDGCDSCKQGLCATCCDGDLGLGIDDGFVKILHLGCDALTECHEAGHWSILVIAIFDGTLDLALKENIRLKIRKALRQIDSIVLTRIGRHHSKYRSAYTR